tara:strand:+ start:1926 stop:2201 length:276 start_codon:yes stop_codon:yes gene_type:complete
MKITKSQLRELIEEEVNKLFLESEEAVERAKKRTLFLKWKDFCADTSADNYPQNEEGALLHYDDMPGDLKNCRAAARMTYLTLRKQQGKLG